MLLPTKVRLEACTLCQLNCPGCYMRHWDHCEFGAGYLKFEDFVSFLELNPYVKEIELSTHGEIFINPDLSRIMAYAFYSKVKLTAWGGVNFNTASQKLLEDLVKYHFDAIVVSIDGWNQETYVQYRRNGNFDNVIANIKLLNQFKEKFNAWQPWLRWKYIIFEHNDDVTGAKIAQNMAKELGMDFVFSRDWGGYEPKNIELPTPTNCAPKPDDIPCSQVWAYPQINWNGRFFGCCMNTNFIYDDENLFKISLADYMKRQNVKDTKLTLSGKRPVCGLNPNCARCRFYKDMQRRDSFISQKDLRKAGLLIRA